jgi:hypothetical protein
MKIIGKIDTLNISTGHKPHLSGAGIHNNKKTKRQNTRSAKLNKIIKEQ